MRDGLHETTSEFPPAVPHTARQSWNIPGCLFHTPPNCPCPGNNPRRPVRLVDAPSTNGENRRCLRKNICPVPTSTRAAATSPRASSDPTPCSHDFPPCRAPALGPLENTVSHNLFPEKTGTFSNLPALFPTFSPTALFPPVSPYRYTKISYGSGAPQPAGPSML